LHLVSAVGSSVRLYPCYYRHRGGMIHFVLTGGPAADPGGSSGGAKMDLRAIEQKLAAFRRTAYVPKVLDRDVGPDQSKFAGVAWINAGAPWHPCGYCGKPMQLFLQLNLSELPMRFENWPERSFVQVFYCTTEETYCEQVGKDAFSPFGKFQCARLVEP